MMKQKLKSFKGCRDDKVQYSEKGRKCVVIDAALTCSILQLVSYAIIVFGTDPNILKMFILFINAYRHCILKSHAPH